MELLSVVAFPGPSLWARVPVLEARVDVGCWQGFSPDRRLETQRRLVDWLSSVAPRPHRAGQGGRGDEEPLSDGWLVETFCDVSLAVQTASGTPVGFAQACGTDDHGIYRVAVEYEEEPVGRASLHLAQDWCIAAVSGHAIDVAAELRRVCEVADGLLWGMSTGAIVAAARARGIPVRRLNQVALVQLGHGAEQRRVQNAVTDRTAVIAESISTDKELTKALLRQIGVPVPAGRPVRDAEDAWAAACELGLAVVVKPRDSDYGNGVSLHLTTRDQVVAAYALARQFSSKVLVERFAAGVPHRVLVVGDRVIAAVRREPPRVVGDGQQTISQLVDQANRDPCRGERPEDPLCRICTDEETLATLAGQGHVLDSVPPAGAQVLLRRHAHYWAGASNEDVTDQVHPEVAAQCVSAAHMVGLDIAGLDVIAEDIGRPLDKQGGVVVEINSEPGIVLHLDPLCDPPRAVGEAIVASLFPPGETGRIPLAAVTGPGETLDPARWIARFLAATGQRVGRASAEGLYLGARRLKCGDQANPAGAQALLLCPEAEAAVLEVPPESILCEGLGFDLCDVAVVTSAVGNATFEQHCGRRREQLAQAVRVVVESVGHEGFLVVNADDPLAEAMTAACPGSVILVASRPDHPLLANWGRPHYRSVCRRGDKIELAARDSRGRVMLIGGLRMLEPLAGGTCAASLMAAVAAGWALGVPLDVMRTELLSGRTSAATSPQDPSADGRPPLQADCMSPSQSDTLVVCERMM